MKYVTLVLVLLLASLVRSPVSSTPTGISRAEAWFQAIDAAGVSTDVTVVVEMRAKVAQVRVGIERTSPSCVSDPHDCPAGSISANTVAAAKRGDFVVARDLTWATLHTTVDATDSRTRQKVAIRIDLEWTAAGEHNAVAGVPS